MIRGPRGEYEHLRLALIELGQDCPEGTQPQLGRDGVDRSGGAQGTQGRLRAW